MKEEKNLMIGWYSFLGVIWLACWTFNDDKNDLIVALVFLALAALMECARLVGKSNN
jgi:hypothetical protein